MPIFFTMMLNFIVLVFICCYFGLLFGLLFVVVTCRCLSLQHFIAHVWRDRLPAPAGLGEQRTPAFDR